MTIEHLPEAVSKGPESLPAVATSPEGRTPTRNLGRPRTGTKHIVALRQVPDKAWLLGNTTADDRDRAQRVAQFRGTRLPTGKHLPVERVGALFAACDTDLDRDDVEDEAQHERLRRTALRDAALLAALYSTGARRSELAAVALADYEPVAWSMRIRYGKRNKERYVYLTSSTVGRIEAWPAVRGSDRGGLFPPFTPRGGHDRAIRPAAWPVAAGAAGRG